MSHKVLALLSLGCALAGACKKVDRGAEAAASQSPQSSGASVPAALDPRLVAMQELAFVPLDVEALVRVDLAGVAARSPDPAQSLKTFDFLLRAQQPIAWQVLSSAGIGVGRELATLFLLVGPNKGGDAADAESYLIAGLGSFDEARLGEALARSGAHAEVLPGGAGQVFVWHERAKANLGAGSNMPSSTKKEANEANFGDAAVGVTAGLLLFGAPEMVKQALAVRSGTGQDIRRGTLARELLAVDGDATLWAVAARAASDKSYLPSVLPGLERGHFSTVLAAPGKDLDGMFTLRAEFASPEQAEAFGKQLRSLLAAADMMTGSTPLGATISEMRKNAKLTLEGKVLVASATL